MKGLLVKDFKLMMLQKNFIFILAAIAVCMVVFTENVTFPLGFLTFVISLFTLNTISYDEYNNSSAFLFTLPITRRSYVMEKYCFGLLCGCVTWFFATLFTVVGCVIRDILSVADIMMIAMAILPFMFITLGIMLPFQLKFGGEKGRIAIIAAVGVVIIVGAVVVKVAEILGIDMVYILNHLPMLSKGMLIGVLMAAAVIFILISLKISIAIMNKKEL